MSSHAALLRFSLCRLGIRCRCPGYLTFRTAFCERHSSGISICRVSASAIRLVGCRPSRMNPTTVSRQHKFGQNGVIEEERFWLILTAQGAEMRSKVEQVSEGKRKRLCQSG